MRNIKLFSLLAATFALSMTFTACTSEYEYEPGPSIEEGQSGNVFFDDAETTIELMPEDDQSITVTLIRVDSTEAQTVALTNSNADVFTAPTTVDFAAGERTKDITIKFDIAQGSSEKFTLAVSEKDAFTYGDTELTFKITRFIVYSGVFVSSVYGDSFEVDIYRVGESLYLLPNAYDYKAPLYFSVGEENKVFVEPQYAWFDEEYGEVWMIGNALNDADATGEGSGEAGTFDPETGLFDLKLLFYVPDLGSFGTLNEQIVITEDDDDDEGED